MISNEFGIRGENYSGEKIEGEIVAATGATAVSYTLPYTPIKPGTVVLTDGVRTATDNGAGSFTGTLVSGGTPAINYETGVVTINIVAAESDVLADWEYDLNSPDAKVSDIDVSVESHPVIARPRKLKSVYMFDKLALVA